MTDYPKSPGAVVIPDADALVAYLEARRDMSLGGEQWDGATAVIEWLRLQIEEIKEG